MMNVEILTQQPQASLLALPDDICRNILRQTGLFWPCLVSIFKECRNLGVIRERRGNDRACSTLPFTTHASLMSPHRICKYSASHVSNLQRCGIECYMRHGHSLCSRICEVELQSRRIDEKYCEHGPFPIAALLVCKKLNSEGTKILYGENTLCLNTWNPVATDHFMQFRAGTLAIMSNLHVFYGPTCHPIKLLDDDVENSALRQTFLQTCQER
jgi:hypothetical protein